MQYQQLEQPTKIGKIRVGTKEERKLDRSLRDWETQEDFDRAFQEKRELEEKYHI